ncbi:MAG: TrmH family RNA methyltransferase [Flavobacteriaceae bacterium]
MQLTHYNTKFKPKKFPITVVAHQVTNAPNIGSLFRICDAFGVEKLVLCGQHIAFGRKAIKTARATEKTVTYAIETETLPIIKNLKTEGYQIIALEITNNSTPVHQFKISTNKPIALIVGDENFGVPEEILNLSHHIVHIDMFGQNSSMNVVQATNIALYEFTKQLL